MLPKLPFVVIQKFCYHGNVTSHFSLLSSLLGLKGLKTRSLQFCDGKEKRSRIPRIMNSYNLRVSPIFLRTVLAFFLLARPSNGELLERKSRLHPRHQMFFSYKNGQVTAILDKTHFNAPTDPVFKNIGILKFHGLQLLNCLCVELLSNTFLFFLSFILSRT